ncbi:MAG: extracellular solute-binding protein [Rhodospirillales bacterium]|nr:extracellular solute-binding protein [Rhodospirillales bacterium]
MTPKRMLLRLGPVCAVAALALAGPNLAAAAEPVWLSTQLRPIEEAQQVRTVILKDSPVKAQFIADQPASFTVRVEAEAKTGHHVVSLLGALHGELEPFVPLGLLQPLDSLVPRLAADKIPNSLMQLGKFGTQHQYYIPWMQATYIMAANRKALPYLPKGANLDHLTYDQLEQWAAAIHKATGQRMLGFPAGPSGLMHRFFEGYLYPAYTGGLVTTFRSPQAVAMWESFRKLWAQVNPNSTNYGFMQEPLLSGDVWIAFDHVARLQDALRKRPNDFVAFPAPSGPKGLAYMPVVAGLAIPKGAPHPAQAAALIAYLSKPSTQILTLKASSFFPADALPTPGNLEPGLKAEGDAVAKMLAAPDAKPALLPVGLGAKGGEFDKIFLDTFQRIVLRHEDPATVLKREGDAMQRILNDVHAKCWAPDPPSAGTCQVD